MFVRTAGERDLPAVRALLIETWHATYDAIYGSDRVTEITEEWHSIASLNARLVRPNAEFVVADDGRHIAAMAYAAAGADAKIVTLHQLYVLPLHQRKGLGRLLLDEIESSFPDARLLRLEVEAANMPARAFYERNGFLPVGGTTQCGGSVFVIPAMVMEKTLG